MLHLAPEQLRWELPLVELLRYRAANLWLQGYRLRRVGRSANRKKRERFDAVAARFNPVA